MVLLCVRVCVLCGRAILNTCQRGTNSKPHFLFRQHPRSTEAAQHHQLRYNTSEPGNAHTHETPAFPLFNLRHPQDFKPFTSRRETLYVYQDNFHTVRRTSSCYTACTIQQHTRCRVPEHLTKTGNLVQAKFPTVHRENGCVLL